jgi:hypothetical protein
MAGRRAAASVAAPETVNVTPSPRILRLIGEIEFKPWQCVAELVDNSFDEFLEIRRSDERWNEPLEVSVTLPSQRTTFEDGEIIVRDNGRGMDLTELTNAVRAGYTGRNPIENLGLFGMGFNVATARLGGVTRFLATRAGDREWVGVEIDVDNMTESFDAPVVREPKDAPEEHGTRVEIRRLHRRSEWLTRPPNQSGLRKTFGGVYSYLLDAEGFRLSVNGVKVAPWRHCLWSAERSVVRDGETIPTIINIDEDLGERAVCRTCGLWQNSANAECEQCPPEAHSELEIRRRRVHGWLGIARELDPREFGVDFLRNGRKIRRFDKDIFRWDDPEDPTGEGEIEYPIETPANQGRIVGEVHLDHVRVVYTKDGFDSSDPAWHGAVRIIRGEGPLRPQRARQMGYGSRNDSPLARLYRGYRRNVPGKAYLMAGTGAAKRARLDTKEWVKKFHDDDPEYQTDEKWWEAVVQHDEIVEAREAQRAAADDRGEESPARELLDGEDAGEEEGPGADSEREADSEGELTDDERLQRLLADAIPLPELGGDFAATGVAARMRLRAFEVQGHRLPVDGRRVPVWITSERGGGFAAFVDLDHPHFRTFDDEPTDVVLMEIAQNLIVRSRPQTTMPISAVFADLKEHHLRARAIDPGRLIPEAGGLMREIQERMVGCVAGNPRRPWENVLTEPERHLTQERIAEALRVTDISEALDNGEYLVYVPPGVVPRIVEDWPDAFFDGELFNMPYAKAPTPGVERQMVARITGYLMDVAWLAGNPVNASRDQMIRARLSLQLLPNELT